MNNQKVKYLWMILWCVLLLGGCKKQPQSEPEIKKEPSKITIGFSMDSFIIERWQRDRDIFVARANELGADVIVQTASGGAKDQISQIKYMIDKEVDVLVIVPNDADQLNNVVNEARKKGIQVISYDRLIRDVELDLYISFDNERVGELIAGTLAGRVSQGNYVIYNGPKTDNNTALLMNGFYKILSPKIQSGDIHILYEEWIEDWEAEKAGYAMVQLLQEEKQVDAVIVGNDAMAAMVIQVLSENRMAGKVAVGGQDADISACQRIVEGTQLMTVYKPIDKLAKLAAEFAVQLAKEEEIITNDIYVKGKYTIPYYKIMPIAVTEENMMDTVIKDGFQRMEAVYQNIPLSQWPQQP